MNSVNIDYISECIEMFGEKDTLKADGFDDCIVGMDTKQRLVYNKELMISKLARDMSREEAVDYFYFNIEGAHMGDYTPIYMDVFDIKMEDK
jgi:hypothetical protein